MTEGYEARALRGSEPTLGRGSSYLYTEVHARHLQRAGDSPEDLASLLCRHDYQALTSNRWRLHRVDGAVPRALQYHANWLLVPSEKRGILPRVRRGYALARLLPRL